MQTEERQQGSSPEPVNLNILDIPWVPRARILSTMATSPVVTQLKLPNEFYNQSPSDLIAVPVLPGRDLTIVPSMATSPVVKQLKLPNEFYNQTPFRS